MDSRSDAWLDALLAQGARGTATVLVTVVAARGSAPRGAGTKMLVSREAVVGTIGGGHLEMQAIDIARNMLDQLLPGALRRFPLGAALGQCCGGSVDLLFETVGATADWPRLVRDALARGAHCVVVSHAHTAAPPGRLVVTADAVQGTLGDARVDALAGAAAREWLTAGDARLMQVAAAEDTASLLFFDPQRACDFNIVLFGAGHVGRALVRALTDVRCRITWVDPRADEFPLEIPSHASAVVTDAPDEAVDAASAGSYFVVMTHEHALDQALAEAILRRGDFAFFGLIGSATKRRLFERRIAARGVAAETLARMTCPIGLAGIRGKEPAVIALAVAAQLVERYEALRRAADGADRRSA